MPSPPAGGFFKPDNIQIVDALPADVLKQVNGKKVSVRLPQDPGQAGKSQASSFVKLLAGYSVIAKPISGDKLTRAQPFAAQVNVGNVRMLKGEWNKDFIDELRHFPNGT